MRTLATGPAALPPTKTEPTETVAKTDISPMPAEELKKQPLYRHIDFFDANKDGKLTIGELRDGLVKLGLSKLQAEIVAIGTVAVRGPPTTHSLKPEIDIANAMKSEQAGSTHLFQADGSVDMAKVEEFIGKLNPQNKPQITMADFAAYGQKLAEERTPDSGLFDHLKRGVMETEFKIAWSGIFSAVGHTNAQGQKYLTNDDVRWFYDGSLFYRRAAELEAAKK